MTDTLELPPVVTDQPNALDAALTELASLLNYCTRLEQRNAALRAENAQLRKRLCLAAAGEVQS